MDWILQQLGCNQQEETAAISRYSRYRKTEVDTSLLGKQSTILDCGLTIAQTSGL